jgi:hypothetical protein
MPHFVVIRVSIYIGDGQTSLPIADYYRAT